MAAQNFVAPCFVLFFTHFFIVRSWQQALLLKIQPAVHRDQVCETHFLQLSKTSTPFFDVCMITAKRNLAFVAWRVTLLSGEAARITISSHFHCPHPGCRSEVPDKTATLRRLNGIQYGVRLLGRTLCYTFLLLCGDVMVNPGPRDKSQISPSGRFARGLCYRAVSWNDQS